MSGCSAGASGDGRGEPAISDLGRGVGGQVVQDDVDGQAAGHGGVDLFEEPQNLGASVAFAQIGEYFAGGQVHGREQIDGAVPLVVMSHRGGPATFHRQRGLGRVQGLALASHQSCTPPPATAG